MHIAQVREAYLYELLYNVLWFQELTKSNVNVGDGWSSQEDLVRGDCISNERLHGVINGQPNSFILAIDEATLQPLGTLQLHVAETYPRFPPSTKGGHQSTHIETTPTNNIAFLGLLSVDPLQQSRGIGRKWMDFRLTYIKDALGRTHDVINALTQRSELIDWYKNLGFIDYGERVCYPDQTRTSHEDVHFFSPSSRSVIEM